MSPENIRGYIKGAMETNGLITSSRYLYLVEALPNKCWAGPNKALRVAVIQELRGKRGKKIHPNSQIHPKD